MDEASSLCGQGQWLNAPIAQRRRLPDDPTRPGSGAALPAVMRGILASGSALLLTGCNVALLDPRGPVASAEKTILLDSLAIMLAIVIPTIIATLAFAWWFRASNTKARYLPDWEFSGSIELVVWAIPLLTILLLSGVTWIGTHRLDPGRPLESSVPPLDIEVVSLDWKWLFIYPGNDVASVNELVVPAGVPLRFSLTSASVMNAFFVPQLGSMIYAMNGMQTRLHLQADQPGEFMGLSAHFSGDGFADMHFKVRALPAEAFDRWVADTRRGGRKLDGTTYKALSRQASPVAPTTFASLEADLFNRIVTQALPPGPGPGTERKGAGTHAAPTSHDKKH